MSEAKLWAALLDEVASGDYRDRQIGAKAAALLESGRAGTIATEIKLPVATSSEGTPAALGSDAPAVDAAAKDPVTGGAEPQQSQAASAQPSLSDEEALQIGLAALEEMGIDLAGLLEHVDQVISTGMS
jgi:hypothetical protein